MFVFGAIAAAFFYGSALADVTTALFSIVLGVPAVLTMLTAGGTVLSAVGTGLACLYRAATGARRRREPALSTPEPIPTGVVLIGKIVSSDVVINAVDNRNV